MNSLISGTLEEKVKEVIKIHREISEIKKGGIRASNTLDKLLESRKKLERSIKKQLSNKEQISDPLLDYCFGNFYEDVFDRIPLVKRFVMRVEGLKGEKILSIYVDKIKGEPSDRNNSIMETGIISGHCEFEVEESFRRLYVQVEKQFVLGRNSTAWEEGDAKIFIDPDIFRLPETFLFKKDDIWKTNRSKKIYIGGQGLGETAIYLGDKYVDKELEKYKHKKMITEANVEIPYPF